MDVKDKSWIRWWLKAYESTHSCQSNRPRCLYCYKWLNNEVLLSPRYFCSTQCSQLFENKK